MEFGEGGEKMGAKEDQREWRSGTAGVEACVGAGGKKVRSEESARVDGLRRNSEAPQGLLCRSAGECSSCGARTFRGKIGETGRGTG